VEDSVKEPEPQPAAASAVEGENIPLLFNVPIGLASRYAHHMLVQTSENETTLSFFELMPPLLTGSIEEQKEILKKGVRADCVSRVTIARARFPEFVKALISQLTAEEKKGISE
jgi:hypothetical protein